MQAQRRCLGKVDLSIIVCLSYRGLRFASELTNPNVAEADRRTGIAMRLQFNCCAIVLAVDRLSAIDGLAEKTEMILHEHAVVERRYVRRRFQRTVGMEGRRGPYDVVALPLAGLARRV